MGDCVLNGSMSTHRVAVKKSLRRSGHRWAKVHMASGLTEFLKSSTTAGVRQTSKQNPFFNNQSRAGSETNWSVWCAQMAFSGDLGSRRFIIWSSLSFSFCSLQQIHRLVGVSPKLSFAKQMSSADFFLLLSLAHGNTPPPPHTHTNMHTHTHSHTHTCTHTDTNTHTHTDTHRHTHTDTHTHTVHTHTYKHTRSSLTHIQPISNSCSFVQPTERATTPSDVTVRNLHTSRDRRSLLTPNRCIWQMNSSKSVF